MKKLTKPLFGVAGGEILPRTYEAGEDCPDDLLVAAQEIGGLETDEEEAAREAAEAEALKAAEAAAEKAAADAAKASAKK